jgi:radical SAM superfamily enzyme YgiQ (UPF0313 family)
MRIALLTVRSHHGCTMKDVAGGYGTVFEVGTSLSARALAAAKGRIAHIPPRVLGLLAARLEGHEVLPVTLDRRPGRRPTPLPAVDRAFLLTSLVDAPAEAQVLRELAAAQVPTVAFGAAANAQPERFEDATTVAQGELETLGADDLLALPPGRAEVGSVDDLDALPFPDWRAFPVDGYRYALLSVNGPTLPAAAARGCPYACGYCPWRVTAAYRERSPARVAAEMALQIARHGVRAFAFRDPMFNLRKDRTLALCRALAPLGVRFSGEMRADRLDDELLVELARAGLRSLEIGVESVNRDMLAAERRQPPDAAQIEHVVRTAQRLGIRVICNFVLGLPGDDEPTIRATVDWAKRLDSFAVQFTVATPYPGTTLADRVDERRLPTVPTGFRPAYLHDAIAPDRLAALREWAYLSYHRRPAYVRRFVRHAVEAWSEEWLATATAPR